jgi:hypothetical protein
LRQLGMAGRGQQCPRQGSNDKRVRAQWSSLPIP